MNGAGEDLLAGASLAGDQDGQRRVGDAAGDGQELGRLFGSPDALGIVREGLGWPQGGALLLVATVLRQRDRRGDQLANRGEGAAVVEPSLRAREELPGLVAVDADVHEVIRPGDLDRGQGLGVAPAVSGDHTTAGAVGGNEGEVVDAAGVLNEREGLASQDVGVRRELEQRDCAVEVVPANILLSIGFGCRQILSGTDAWPHNSLLISAGLEKTTCACKELFSSCAFCIE